MPFYAYKCDACGFAKDVLQKMSDDPLSDCPRCGKAEFKKQLTAAGFQLKGSGWYVTDFRGDTSAGGAKPDGADGAEGPAVPAPSESSPEAAAPATPTAAPAATPSTPSTPAAAPAASGPAPAASA